jgi:ElaB/YqjD/DUF883 family membrane-anchored ribosome-binding protein
MAVRTGRAITQSRSDATEGAASERIQDSATGLIDQAGRTAQAQANHTLNQAGDALSQVARAVRDAGDGLREQRPEIAGIADTAAERVDQAATYLRQHEPQELIDSATDFARRQPALVIGGALVAGLVLGRLLRSGTEAAIEGGTAGSGSLGPRRFAAGQFDDTSADAYSRSPRARAGYGTDYGETGYGNTGYRNAARGNEGGGVGSGTGYGRPDTATAHGRGAPDLQEGRSTSDAVDVTSSSTGRMSEEA